MRPWKWGICFKESRDLSERENQESWKKKKQNYPQNFDPVKYHRTNLTFWPLQILRVELGCGAEGKIRDQKIIPNPGEKTF